MLKLDLVKQIEAVDPSLVSTNFGVMDMAQDFKNVVRGVKTAPKDDISMWVYRPHDTYPMGYISYGNLMDNGDETKRYSVFTPNISNGKYKHGERMFMASALSRDKAVKNATKYLRPLSPTQVLEQVQGEFVGKRYSARGDTERAAQQEMRKVRTDLFSSGTEAPLLAELKRILQSGYEFVDKELEVNFRRSVQVWEEREANRTAKTAAFSFVEIVQQAGQTMFRGYNKVPEFRSIYNTEFTSTAFSYTQEELPDHLLGAISVLSMVDQGQYVEGVGYRAADTMFYVKCV